MSSLRLATANGQAMLDRQDAGDMLGRTKHITDDDWTPFNLDSVIFQTCCHCGLAHQLMFRKDIVDSDPGAYLARFVNEEHLTEQVREQDEDKFGIPIYREVVRLREENITLRRRVLQLEAELGK